MSVRILHLNGALHVQERALIGGLALADPTTSLELAHALDDAPSECQAALRAWLTASLPRFKPWFSPDEHMLHVRRLSSELLCVVAERASNLAALRMALVLVARRIESLFEAGSQQAPRPVDDGPPLAVGGAARRRHT